MRIRRNCSHAYNYTNQERDLKDRLLARGYSIETLRGAHKNVLPKHRQDLLVPKIKCRGEPIRLIGTYDHKAYNETF